jgi:hypothetical protein
LPLFSLFATSWLHIAVFLGAPPPPTTDNDPLSLGFAPLRVYRVANRRLPTTDARERSASAQERSAKPLSAQGAWSSGSFRWVAHVGGHGSFQHCRSKPFRPGALTAFLHANRSAGRLPGCHVSD